MDGVLLVDKPLGVSSASFSRQVGHCLQQKKVGHGGTLDPLATGLMVILLGEATKFARFLLSGDKQYTATATFGVRSATLDSEGPLSDGTPPPANLAHAITQALPNFIGNIQQIPPQASAIKHQGKPLYHYARRGIAVPIAPKSVTIHSLKITHVDTALQQAQLSVHCSGGTYIRSLVRDIGQALHSDAYLSVLKRTASHPFYLDNAVDWATLQNAHDKRQFLLNPRVLFSHLPAQTLSLNNIKKLGQGQRLPHPQPQPNTELLKIEDDNGNLAGLAKNKDNLLQPIYFLNWTRLT